MLPESFHHVGTSVSSIKLDKVYKNYIVSPTVFQHFFKAIQSIEPVQAAGEGRENRFFEPFLRS